jgi:hypothetical protein
LVRTLSFLALAALAPTSFAQAKPDPVAIAKRADAAIAAVKSNSGDGLLKMEIRGAKGYSRTRLAIKDSKTFAIEYTIIKGTYPARGEVRSNKGRIAFRDTDAPEGTPEWQTLDRNPYPFYLKGAALVKAFPLQFGQLVYSPLVTGKGVLADYVASANRLGYTISVAQKSAFAQGIEMKSSRVTLVNSAKSQAKEGLIRMDLVFDQRYGLPVTIYTTLQPKGAKRTIMTWTMGWARAKELPAKAFKLPQTLNKPVKVK